MLVNHLQNAFNYIQLDNISQSLLNMSKHVETMKW